MSSNSFAGWKRDITIDLDRDRVECAFLEAYQGDKRANFWNVHVLTNGVAADLQGFAARAYFIRPDGNTVDMEGSITDNLVSVELDEHVYTYSGRASGALVIENSTHSITIDAMKLNILKRNTDIVTPDDDIFVVIGSGPLDTDAQTVVGAINELNSEIRGVEAISNAEIDAIFT